MPQLIVALDVNKPDDAERLIDELYELDLIYKVGMESLYGYGERIFSYMEARDVRHFIDAKVQPLRHIETRNEIFKAGAIDAAEIFHGHDAFDEPVFPHPRVPDARSLLFCS